MPKGACRAQACAKALSNTSTTPLFSAGAAWGRLARTESGQEQGDEVVIHADRGTDATSLRQGKYLLRLAGNEGGKAMLRFQPNGCRRPGTAVDYNGDSASWKIHGYLQLVDLTGR